MLDPKSFNLPELEEKVLKFWKENNIFQKSLEARKGSEPFRFYEGPPYANGKPGIHHVLARVFKDVVIRQKTMEGRFVERKAGWDTHGLPVEIATEKALGLTSKTDIEKYGVAAFNKKVKEAVWTYKDEWENLTERIGYWLDLENPYITYEPKYIESLWWIFSELDKRKLFKKLHKVLPWCTRCGTALSSHELAQGYKEVSDTSVYVKFRLKTNDKRLAKTPLGKILASLVVSRQSSVSIVSWTTTPWTLPGNVALAVGENIPYAIAKNEADEYIILADEILQKGGIFAGYTKAGELRGKDLLGLSYEPLFSVRGQKSPKSHKIYAADFVTTTEGTGVVHTAVMYGEDDYALGKEIGLPMMHTVGIDGKFTNVVPALAGMYVRSGKTEEKILGLLEANGALFAKMPHTHEYPFCWRCGTAVIYYARDSWFIMMSKLRDELLKANQSINWIPEHIKEGRFGEWIKEAKDWALSRERYWGTPIPVWEHEKTSKCKKPYHLVGSLADLDKARMTKPTTFALVRHTDATHIAENRFAAGPETEKNRSRLTKAGEKEAEKIARALTKKKIDLIVASPMYRTKQMATIIGKITKKKVIYDKRLVEQYPGMFAEKHIREYQAHFASPLEEFTKEIPGGGENMAMVARRMWAAISDLEKKYPGKRIAIVSHGNPLWGLEGLLRGLSHKKTASLSEFKLGEVRILEKRNWPTDESGLLDLHRPYIDEIKLRCPTCKKPMRRIKEVADVWFDAGSVPWAEWHYPFENKDKIDAGLHFPADYIAEGMDQTRGWFYVMLALSAALGRGAPYKNVISLGLINDKEGVKMSKSRGNIVEPFSVIQKYGTDPLRWYFFTASGPGETKRFDEGEVGKMLRRFFLILYNTYVFYRTAPEPEGKSLQALDEWILARVAEIKKEVGERLNAYDITGAARAIEPLIDDLSRWYIRRTRKRLSHETLTKVFLEISKMLAPFVPFFAESLYQSVSPEAARYKISTKESVHLEDWGTNAKYNTGLLEQMSEARKIAGAGLKSREEAKIKVRQPLQRLKVKSEKIKSLPFDIIEAIKEEINVKEISFDASIEGEVWLDTAITPELKAEGALREIARIIQDLRADAGLSQKDEVALHIETENTLRSVLEPHYEELKKRVRARTISFGKTDSFDAEIETKFEDSPLWIAVRKL